MGSPPSLPSANPPPRSEIDASAAGTGNVTTVLNQVRMMSEHPVFDPELNRKILVDHIYIIASGTITKQARNFPIEKLDASQRRFIIFMDREELLDLAVDAGLAVPQMI
jgi:hypothetical protein